MSAPLTIISEGDRLIVRVKRSLRLGEVARIGRAAQECMDHPGMPIVVDDSFELYLLKKGSEVVVELGGEDA